MGYTPAYLVLHVEAKEATWLFQPADRALARLMGTIGEGDAVDTTRLNPEQMEALLDAWQEGLVGWEGVGDPDPARRGAPLPFNARNKQLIPTTDKLEIAAAFLEQSLELQVGKARSGEPRSDSMPLNTASPEAPSS